MIWPFSDSHRKKALIAKLEGEVSDTRSNLLYPKLFELDRLDRDLDHMVSESLKLLQPGHKNEPPST